MSDNTQTKTNRIATLCNTVLTANADHCQANCSGFLKQMAAKLGIVINAQLANGIVDYLGTAPGWQQLGNGTKRASELAGLGYFVVAGLKADGHGHVAIVVPGWSPQGFPMGYWGSMRGAAYAGFNRSLSLSFTRTQLKTVSYFATPVATVSA